MALSAHAETNELDASRQKDVTRLVVATSLGNALEWFDISVYAYFAAYQRTKPSPRTRLKCSPNPALRPPLVRAIMVPLPVPASQETAQSA